MSYTGRVALTDMQNIQPHQEVFARRGIDKNCIAHALSLILAHCVGCFPVAKDYLGVGGKHLSLAVSAGREVAGQIAQADLG